MDAADAMMRGLIDFEAEINAHKQALTTIANDIAREDQIVCHLVKRSLIAPC